MTRFTGTDTYVATEDLMMAVNAAITLERPLLIKGEPGTGKTMLALEVSRALDRPLFQWHVKSTAKAQQGLYEYDAVSRLRDSQLGDPRVHDIANYIKRGPVWEAFDSPKPAVLLIDEVDKADPEFEAFLLEVLSDFQVSIPELGTVRAVERPVVLLTSNRTRELSEALLRRCLHLFVDFPPPEKEAEIVALKVPELDERLRLQVTRFVAGLRKLDLKKAPSIAETLDWARGLCALGVRELDAATVRRTLALVLKHEEDLRKAEGKVGVLLGTPGGR
jgi:MoxR-like ATPase